MEVRTVLFRTRPARLLNEGVTRGQNLAKTAADPVEKLYLQHMLKSNDK